MPNIHPSNRSPKSHSSNRFLYLLAITVGILYALYIYGIAFNDLSEDELVQLSALWVLSIVFGVYGFVAEKLLQLIDEGDDLTIFRATQIWTSTVPIIGVILMLPFLFIKGKNPLVIALLATLFWALLLAGFFAVIFPLL
ncbi:MAG: hypothetical protein P8179_09050 [Candidatus Thiodiazotropha sp.]|jgi:hypothetical protein